MSDPYAGMSEADKARCQASDSNLSGIIEGRRRAARLLLATNPAPAKTVKDAWEALRQKLHGET